MKRMVLGAVLGAMLGFNSAQAQEVHVGQDMQCALCWDEKNSTVCMYAPLTQYDFSQFFYHVGTRLGEIDVKKWFFECSAHDKKIKGF